MPATTEDEVGISCYVSSKTVPFTAILKHRYSDFLVNELDASGQVVRLTSLACPAPEEQQQQAKQAPAAPKAAPASTETSSRSQTDWAEAAQVLGSAQAESVQQYFQQIAAYEGFQRQHAAGEKSPQAEGFVHKPARCITLPASSDKAARTAVHAWFKQPGMPNVSTETVAGKDGGSSIRVTYHAQGKKRKRDGGESRRERDPWPSAAEPFCRFALYKENMDSGAALALLARSLHCAPGSLGTAGTKDKRAVTVQHVTAFKVPPARLAAASERLRGVKLGDYALVRQGLHLGDARGNRFEVTLRDVRAGSLADVAAAAESLKANGFINYYGLQRFGSGGAATHAVGVALLKGDWRGAVRLILAPREGERDDCAAARRLYLDGEDIEGALRGLPRFLSVERGMLEVLRKQGPKAYSAALQAIPRNTRLIYVHAYQSYLWNAAVSHRVRTYGAQRAVEGDLVLLQSSSAEAEEGAAAAAEERGALPQVHVVSAEEAEAGAYSIEDVVLPKPGCRVVYPEHATAGVYAEVAARDGISLTSAPHRHKDFSLLALPGDYRRVLHRPADLAWRLLAYADPDEPLAQTDLGRLQGEAPPGVTAVSADDDEELKEGQLVALQLAFNLPTSCYATMLVRELTKSSTAKDVHRALTQAPAVAE